MRIRRGDFATVREIVLVSGLPRQTINRWLRAEAIDLTTMRMRHLAKVRTQDQRYLEGMGPIRKLSKRKMRQVAAEAKRQWDQAHGEVSN